MEQNKGVKKETRRHYVGYFREDECHIERLECVEVYEYDSDGYVFRHKSENYDDNGELSYGTITNRRYGKGEYILDICDLEGKCLGYEKYDAKWQHIESRFNQLQRWFYDSYGRMIEELNECSNGWLKIQFEYNSDGRVTRSTRVTDKSDVQVAHHYYSRDCMGNIVESVIEDDGVLLESNVIDRLSGKVILNREECIEDKWTAIQRCFKNDIQVSCASWHSDDLMKSAHIKYLDSCMNDWKVSIEPYIAYTEEDSDMIERKCRITIRDIEYEAFDDDYLHEFVDF